jgi:hypothetical protein
MKKTLLFLFLLFCCKSSFAQKPCEKDPTYNQFDFWLGEWEVYDLKGNVAGNSKITKILDNCVVLEEWTSAGAQQGLVFSGKSYNTYNSASKQWQQNWVDNTGGTTEFLTGAYENNTMHFLSRPFLSNGKTAIRKLTFFKLENGRVRQFGEISYDDSKSWTAEYDLEYRKKQ